ncbi:MAG TPA: HAMP domain-containing sensor histidine kinase [Thermoanaerobaculia bacterium]|nr:HAMP domain-containing sensor histidine kinase [Thermoanaerobaculia bacterium]
MSLAVSSVPPFPAGAPGSTGAAVARTLRGRSAGRRIGDERSGWVDPTALLLNGITPGEAADTVSAQRDRMIAMFGHDLRGLLNALTVNAEVFLRQEGETAAKSARNVRLAVGRMDQLITSLLDYARVKAHKLEVVRRPFDAAELVREAVEIFRPLARVKSLSLILAVPDGPLPAVADHDRIFQVLSNLVSNAIKFSSVKGDITVQATTLGHALQFAVTDDGPGIPQRDLERVFDCFCQLQDSDARGLGLGLYISRAIVQAHGGRIWATSRPGAGSTFHFTVPRSDSGRASERSPGGVARAATA